MYAEHMLTWQIVRNVLVDENACLSTFLWTLVISFPVWLLGFMDKNIASQVES